MEVIKHPSLYQTVDRIVGMSRRDFKGIEGVGFKLMEEVGELSEAVNHSLGNLPHKTLKEPVIGEVADVIQNAIALAALVYPNKTGAELAEMLEDYLDSKTTKWESILVENTPAPSAQDIKNAMCIEGHLNQCLRDIIESSGELGGTDAVFNHITAVVLQAIDKCYGIKQTPEQQRENLSNAFDPTI
jgi:NTP pyrophosphatase (non-canonical NTP hydrolase)